MTVRLLSAVTGGLMAFICSILLFVLSRRTLPDPIKIGTGRMAVLVGATLLGTLSILTFWQQGQRLFG